MAERKPRRLQCMAYFSLFDFLMHSLLLSAATVGFTPRLTGDNTNTDAAAPGAHGRHHRPVVPLGIIHLDTIQAYRST